MEGFWSHSSRYFCFVLLKNIDWSLKTRELRKSLKRPSILSVRTSVRTCMNYGRPWSGWNVLVNGFMLSGSLCPAVFCHLSFRADSVRLLCSALTVYMLVCGLWLVHSFCDDCWFLNIMKHSVPPQGAREDGFTHDTLSGTEINNPTD